MEIEIDKARCPLLHNVRLLHLLDMYGMRYEIGKNSSIFAYFNCCHQWRVHFDSSEDKYGIYIITESGKGYKYTDFNEMVAVVFSAMLNLDGVCTIRHIGDLSFCSETEIDRMILLIMQPHFNHFNITDDSHLNLIERILENLSFIHEYFFEIFDATRDENISNPIYGNDVKTTWVNNLVDRFGTSEISVITRSKPNWTYLRFFDPEVAICSFPKLCHFLKKLVKNRKYNPIKLSGVDSDILLNNNLKNTIPKKVREQLVEISHLLDDNSDQTILAQENHVLMITDNHIICIYCNSSIHSFYDEKNKISERQRIENELLLFDRNLKWKIKKREQSSRFEELILSLFKREPYVKSAKLASNTNEPDDGRDLIIEYYPDYFTNLTKTNEDRQVAKGIVQCKTRLKNSKKQSVGWPDINDIYNVFALHKPKCYFLVVNTYVTNQVTRTFESLKIENNFGIELLDWWCKNDIEDRLRSNPDILSRFQDIVDYEDKI